MAIMSNKFDSNNYITIQGFMVNELGLKGNELLVFAIIFGFTQQDDEWYHGSLSYLMSALGCNSKNTVMNALQSLVEKGYIIKEYYEVNNVRFCKYKKNDIVVQNLIWGGAKNEPNNNIIYNIKENNNTNISNDILLLLKENAELKKKIAQLEKKKKSSFEPPTLEEIEQYCNERGNKVNAKKFFDYYSVAKWKDKDGRPVKNWKQKLIANWEKDDGVEQVEKVSNAERKRKVIEEYMKENGIND